MTPEAKVQRFGFICAASAYLLWGLFPLYFRLIRAVPAQEILAHRILWSVPATLILIVVLRQPWQLRAIVQSRQLFGALICSSLLVSSNWLLFTWAVTHDRVLDTSLGYFINPLLTIVLGVVVLREKMSRWQWLAVALAGVGVSWQIVMRGDVPWISLSLALTFSLYGLIRKRTPVNPLNGLLVETTLLLPLALGYLIWLGVHAQGVFGSDFHLSWLLSLAGLITMIPLMLFAAGARRIPLTHMGFLQYISPSCTFLLALLVFHEPFDAHRLLSFGFIWAGLIILLIDSLRKR